MPTYRCLSSIELSETTRASLAQAITHTHAEVTGAPTYFAQVVFERVEDGRIFIGGHPLRHDHLFVHGFIRAGRTPAQRTALVQGLTQDVVDATGLPRRSVWVYVMELEAMHMVEFGCILPESGQEASWTEGLDPELRTWMEKLSHGRS